MSDIQCSRCGFSASTEFYNVRPNKDEVSLPFCAKCYVEKYLREQPYFFDIQSPSSAKIPNRRHYLTASIVRFISLVSEEIESLATSKFYAGGVPFSAKFNLINFECETIHLVGRHEETKRQVILPKLILFIREIHSALDLSIHLALNNYHRSAISELRFVIEKCFDFLYLLLPSSVGIQLQNDISFEDWVLQKEFRSSIKQRSRSLGQHVIYDPYACYRALCGASHGVRSHFNSSPWGSASISMPWQFATFNRWFSLYCWCLEIVRDFICQYATETSLLPDLQTTIETYTETVRWFEPFINEAKEGKFRVIEFPEDGASYWTDIYLNIKWQFEKNISSERQKKLLDDYCFLELMADMPPK